MNTTKLWDKKHIPNEDGFKFTGYDNNGEQHACMVRRNKNTNQHEVLGLAFADMAGWRPFEKDYLCWACIHKKLHHAGNTCCNINALWEIDQREKNKTMSEEGDL